MNTITLRNRLILLLIIAAAGLGARGTMAQAPHTHQHSFGDAEKWAGVFDDPKRDAVQKPHEVIKALGLKPDAVVADVGSGTGYFAVRLARMLPGGKVYGVDVEPDMVKHLAARATKEGIANLVSVAGAADDARLPEKVDLVIMVNVFHHLSDREAYLRRLGASLKPGGRIAVIDFRMDSPTGPPKSARLTPAKVKGEFKSAGFAFLREHAFLPQQYFLEFQLSGG